MAYINGNSLLMPIEAVLTRYVKTGVSPLTISTPHTESNMPVSLSNYTEVHGFVKGDTATAYSVTHDTPTIENFTPLNYGVDDVNTPNGFNPNVHYETIVLTENHKKGFSVHFDSFTGYSIGAILTDGENYYTLRLVGAEGGDVVCAIDGNTVYLTINNGDVSAYTVAHYGEQLEIAFISCDGEEFAYDYSTGDRKQYIYDCVYKNGTNVKLTVRGKNLTNWEDTSKWVMDWGAKNKRGYLLPIVQGQQICVTFGANDSNDAPQYFYLSSCDAEGKVNGLCTFTGDKTAVFYKKYIFTPQAGLSYYLYPGSSTTSSNDDIFSTWLSKFSYIQCEIGSTETEYEPYVEPVTYNANPDGIVEGVNKPAKTIILETDEAGVVIRAKPLADNYYKTEFPR